MTVYGSIAMRLGSSFPIGMDLTLASCSRIVNIYSRWFAVSGVSCDVEHAILQCESPNLEIRLERVGTFAERADENPALSLRNVQVPRVVARHRLRVTLVNRAHLPDLTSYTATVKLAIPTYLCRHQGTLWIYRDLGGQKLATLWNHVWRVERRSYLANPSASAPSYPTQSEPRATRIVTA